MYDYLVKIILLGPSGAGKSCLLHRFTSTPPTFPVLTSQTLGVDFSSRLLTLGTSSSTKTRLKLQLWDTAGTERFRSVARSYYRGAAGALLIHDVSRPATQERLEELGTFLADARALGSERLCVVLVGNKSDVSGDDDGGGGGGQGEVARWAERVGIRDVRVASALTGEGVEEAFRRVAEMVLTRVELGEVDPSAGASGVQFGERVVEADEDVGVGGKGWFGRRRGKKRRRSAATSVMIDEDEREGSRSRRRGSAAATGSCAC